MCRNHSGIRSASDMPVAEREMEEESAMYQGVRGRISSVMK
jgi:hypothetical protein